ncbi:MAG: exodeoxyribonuclease VII large subunit [Pedosphaera sp.]|nr:exodeoxyribonuclease VII large subunit [Pedosphaera sp.]
MARSGKTQWDFGELFSPEETRRVLTVAELTAQVKRVIEQQVGQVWVTGEITNLRAQSSGHIYFTLKDAAAQLSCVLFAREPGIARDLLRDGAKVVLRGDVTVYEARGQYQMIVRAVELQGVGALQLAFEKLKQKLAAEGLFAQERKRPLPRFPQRIGIVTSPTGAALRDVLHVLQRRHAGVEVILAPCRVQGQGAAEEIAAAVRLLNEWSLMQPEELRLDLILVTRGGGSLEDLWAFNEEAVARALFESALPVVSAVGHEIDFTISDFVADLRAATPSVAAEIITEHFVASRDFVAEAGLRLRQLVQQRLESVREGLGHCVHRLKLAHPRRRLDAHLQRFDDLHAALLRGVNNRRQILHHQMQTLSARLRLLGPENVLARGYSITTDAATGKVIRAASEVRAGQKLRTRLSKGEVQSTAED